MSYRVLGLIILLVVIGCNSRKNKNYPLLSFVPKDASVVIKINNLNSFRSELKNNQFLSDAADSEIVQKIRSAFADLKSFQTDTTCLVALIEKDTPTILIVSYASPIMSKANDSSHVNKSDSLELKSGETDSTAFFSRMHNGINLLSNSESLIQIKDDETYKQAMDPILSNLYMTASPEKSATIFVNKNIPSQILPPFLSNENPRTDLKFSQWLAFDFSSSQRMISLNGLTHSQDTTQNILGLFKGTKPLQSITPSIAPKNTDAILSFTFDEYEVFAQNQRTYFNSPYSMNSPVNSVEEVGQIFQNGNRAVVVSSYNSEGVQVFLDGIAKLNSDYQGHEIYALSANQFLNEAFKPLITDFLANFYTILDNRYVFSENRGMLENIINNFNSGSSFKTSSLFQSASESLANESHVQFIAGKKGMKEVSTGFLSKEILEVIEQGISDEYVYSSQLLSNEDYCYSHFTVHKLGSNQLSGTTSPLFTVELDGDIATDPQFVINHRTNKKEIVVQDGENNLYLISTEGKVLWKKQLDARIQGKIHQVDLYKNGRLQLAFTTSNQFIILDRNGKEVAPFNMSYPGGNLTPLAVFDYENNKNYRFVITQGTSVFMYNRLGNIVTGFTYTESEQPSITSPKHIRIGQRDYLLFKLENNKLKILNRVGKDRIQIDQEINFSTNEVYQYRDKFILTDVKGVLYTIDTSGKLTRSPLNFNEDHGLTATSRTLVTQNENTLSIKGRPRDLDLGVYLSPRIFYVYDKIYVSTTDIQSGLVYLFDSQNRSISNFPVFGNSSIDLADIDNDGKVEIVTKDRENSLIVYSIR